MVTLLLFSFVLFNSSSAILCFIANLKKKVQVHSIIQLKQKNSK